MKKRTKFYLKWIVLAFICPLTTFGIPTFVSDTFFKEEASFWPIVLLGSIAASWTAFFVLNGNKHDYWFDDER